MRKEQVEHDVAFDYGIDSKPRYKCRTCQQELVQEPNMDMSDWEEERDRFLADQPCQKAINEARLYDPHWLG